MAIRVKKITQEEAIRVKKITQEELNIILEQHKLWLETDCKQGKRADLSYIDLSYMNLSCKDLRGANLTGADLSYAILTGAILTGADLTNIKHNSSTSFFALACPEEGTFIGFKKAYDQKSNPYIVKLLIPENAKRSSATTRKCRCSKAKVLSITNLDGTNAEIEEVHSKHDIDFSYKLGETIEVEDFDDDRWKECTSGIHFFITRDEAVRY